MEGFRLASEKSGFLSDGELLPSSYGGVRPSKPKSSDPLLLSQLVACLGLAEFPFVVV